MFDKVMFEKICALNCTTEELKAFNRGMDKKEFDLDNPFEKYYSADVILKCIKLYQKRIVTVDFLAYWANAYNWIIMGGFRTEINDETPKTISIDTVLIWEISDWLDSVSFADWYEDFYEVKDAAKAFRTLDSIYKNYKKWQIYYSFTDEKYDDDTFVNDINVLLVNESKELYAIIHSECCDFKECQLQNATLVDDIDYLISDLKSKKYKNIL